MWQLTPQILDNIQAAEDDFINNAGQPCQLVYSPRLNFCPNCTFNPSANRSTGIYKTGGPVPFSDNGICPICNGAGKRADTASEIVQMLVAWSPKQWFVKPPNVGLVEDMIQTKGFVSDIPKVLNCIEMITSLDTDASIHTKFVKAGKPVFPYSLVQGRYFVMTWRRTN